MSEQNTPTTRIKLQVGKKEILYHSETRVVTFYTRHGALIESEMPKDWLITRVFQFMSTLIEADEIIS